MGRKVTENADRQSEKIKQNRSTKDEQAKENSAKLKKKYSRGGDVIIGNVPFRYIPKKTYTKIEQDILEDVTKKLAESGMKFSGVIKSDGVTLTTSETDKAKLDSIIEEVRSVTKNNSVAEQQTEKEKVATNGNSDNTKNVPETSDNNETNEQPESDSAEKVATYGNSDTTENTPETSDNNDTNEQSESGSDEECQYLYSVQHLDDLWYFKVSEDKLNDVLKIASGEKPFQKLMELGEPISIEEYAEIQQSDRFGQSIAVNFDNYTAEYYTVNGGKGGFSDGDRTDENTVFETVEIPRPELKDQTEKEEVATNDNPDVPEKNFQHENVEIVERPARPTITCEWSESPFFEEGKTYSVAEFDKIMSDADRQKVEGYKKHMEAYGNADLWLESDKDSYYNFIGYDKTKFTINLPNGKSLTERQDIGDGYGGVVDFLRSFEKNSNYNKIADILEDDIKNILLKVLIKTANFLNQNKKRLHQLFQIRKSVTKLSRKNYLKQRKSVTIKIPNCVRF